MKILIKSILSLISMLILSSCGSIESARVQEMSEISPSEKSVYLRLNESELIHSLYEHFLSKGYKVYESADDVSDVGETRIIHKQTRGTFSVKYSLTYVDYDLIYGNIYTGYISLVNLKTGKLAYSIRFTRKFESTILENVKRDMLKNVIVK